MGPSNPFTPLIARSARSPLIARSARSPLISGVGYPLIWGLWGLFFFSAMIFFSKS